MRAPGRGRTLSIRARLLLVGGATVLLVVGLLASMVLHGLKMARESAIQRLLNVAEATSDNVEELIDRTHAAATRFAVDAAAVLADPRRCDAWLGRTLDVMPQYTNLMLTNARGRPVCSYVPGVVGVIDYSDRPWLPDVLEGRFTVSDPLIGKRFPVWSVILAGPVMADGRQAPVGAVVFALDLARVQNFTTGVTLPPRSVVTVSSAAGVIVTRSRDPERWVGQQLPPPTATESPIGEGTITEAISMEGDPTLFVSVAVPGTSWRVYAGWSKAEALSPAWGEARRSAFIASLLVLLTVGGIAWVYIPTTRSLRRLVSGAEAAANHRTPLTPEGPDEIHTVASQINETLGILATAEAEAGKLAQVTRQFADPVFIAGRDGVIEYVNPAWEHVTGFHATEAIGRKPQDLSCRQTESGSFESVWLCVLEGHPFRGRVRSRRKDGTSYTDDLTLTPLRDASGAITHIVATSRDVTEADAMAERLREAEKLKAVGQLAGGVAHDFNNLLTAITGYAELLELDLERVPPQLREHVEEILKGARMARSLTHQLLTFSRREVVQERNVSLNDVITRLMSFLSRVIPADVTVRKELDLRVGPVWIDAVHAEQIVLNLALNARDAMPGGGTMVFRTRTESDGRGSAWTVLEVEDSGQGIAPEIRDRIFDPFFTTKQRGTGLGLATVHDVVTRAGGMIEIESRQGEGSVFRVRLPCSTSAPDFPAEPGDSTAVTRAAHSHGRGLVLVAEDNEAVRSFLSRVLSSAGYTVLEAPDGAEALRRVERLGTRPAIVVTDVMMPRMKGPAMVAELRRRWPDLPAVFVSGYADLDLDVAVPEGPTSEMMTKPVSPADLRDAVARLLGEAAASPARTAT